MLENTKAEYRELIATLSKSYHTLAKYWPVDGPLMAISPAEDREAGEAWLAGLQVIEDRIFVDREVRAENIREKWFGMGTGTVQENKDRWKDLHDVLVKMAHHHLRIK